MSPSVCSSGDAVERAVSEIRLLTRRAALQVALEVGEMVFRNIFASDLELVRQHGPKHASFRRLALHPALPMSAAGLWRAVATFELSQRIPHVANSKHLGASHVYAVLGLPAPEQEQLLHRAEHEGWKPAMLQQQAASKRKGAGGRPPKLMIVRALDSLRRVASLPRATFTDSRSVRRMRPEEVAAALITIEELDERLEELRVLLMNAAQNPQSGVSD